MNTININYYDDIYNIYRYSLVRFLVQVKKRGRDKPKIPNDNIISKIRSKKVWF